MATHPTPFYAWRNKHSGLYISKSPASRMILSRSPDMIQFFTEENQGESLKRAFFRLAELNSYSNPTKEEFEMVEITLP